MAEPGHCGPRPCGEVLLVEDDDLLREQLYGFLRGAGYAVEAAACGASALESARRRPPEVAVLDVCLPGLSGYEICRSLKELQPAPAVLFVSGERVQPLDRVAGLLIGDDYLVKPFAPDELLARLRALHGRRERPAADNGRGLTRREVEVLRCLCEGLDPATIAERLVISQKTVGTHLEHIFRKLEVSSRAQAVALAFRERLFAVD